MDTDKQAFRVHSKLSTYTGFLLVKAMGACAFARPVFF